MTALPFIFDRFGNGSVSIFTFEGLERRVVTAVPNQQRMYFGTDVGMGRLGEIWSLMLLLVSMQLASILPL